MSCVSDLETGNKNCALWSQAIRLRFLRKLVLFLCARSETQTALSFCQSLLFIGPCETLSSVTNTDESLTMCHNIWANESADLCSMAHHSISSFCQTGLGAELWYYFATETLPCVSSFLKEKRQQAWPNEALFSGLNHLFPDGPSVSLSGVC